MLIMLSFLLLLFCAGVALFPLVCVSCIVWTVLILRESDSLVEQARRTMVRCGMGFGSSAMCTAQTTGFRGSATRSGSTPAGDWANHAEDVTAVAERMRGVLVENRDGLDLIEYHDARSTLFYCDPPYVHSVRKMLDVKGRYRHEMANEDHQELARTLCSLKGMVMLSGYRTSLYDDLYPGWERVECAAMADGAKARTECLWFNPAAWERRPQPDLMEHVRPMEKVG